MKRTTQQNSKRKKVLRTAIRLFKKEGYYNVSIEDIVRSSDTSIATFYSYFGAKEEVVCTYRNDSLAKCQEYYDKLLEDPAYAGCHGLRLLYEFLRQVTALLDQVGVEFSGVFAQRRLKEHDPNEDDKPYLPAVRELIAKGQEDGSIRTDFSARQLVEITDRFLVGSCLRWQLHRNEDACDASTENTLALFCDTIGAARKLEADRPFPPLHDVWETALYMLIPDPRSGIKQVEEGWLERFYKD